MRESLYGHPIAGELLSAVGPVERSVFWTCGATGVRRKSRADKVVEVDGKRIVVELKSAAEVSPEGFAQAAMRWGYHRQACYLSDGIAALTGERPRVLIVAVQKTPPFVCRVFEFDADSLAAGRREVLEGLRQLRRCQETGDWSEPGEHEITTLRLPVKTEPIKLTVGGRTVSL